MYLLVVFISVFCFTSVPVTKCDKHVGTIVGGDDVPIEKVPYQISLQYNGTHSCGGSIITPTYVITAAHCTEELKEEYLSVRAGTSIRESDGQEIKVKKINAHPEYSSSTMDYDIGVLELSDNLEFGFRVAPIRLPSKDQTWPVGTEVLITGWGLTDQDSRELPLNLQGVTVQLVDQDTCNNIFKTYGVSITERMFCAGVDEGGKDSCQDDSGGPLQVDGILAGVVSFGIGCGEPGFPGVYTNVSVVLDFIQKIIGS